MNRLLRFPLTLVAVLVAHVPLLSAATINIVATSNIGGALAPEVHLYQAGSHNDLWPSRRGQVAHDVPHGYYRIEVSLPGFAPYERELEVGDASMDIRVVLTPSMEAVGRLELAGRVIQVKSYEKLWVMIFPLSGSPTHVAESLVSGAGTFKLGTTHGGPYLLAVVRGEEILNCRQVYIGSRNPELTIDLHEVP